MLEKSKKSALILSTLLTLSYTITSAFLNLLLPYLLTSDIHTVVENPDTLASPTGTLTLVLIIFILLLLLTLLGAYFMYRYFGEAYFGRRSALRWALTGILAALLFQIPDWLHLEQSFLKSFWNTASILIAFFLARAILPLERPGK